MRVTLTLAIPIEELKESSPPKFPPAVSSRDPCLAELIENMLEPMPANRLNASELLDLLDDCPPL